MKITSFSKINTNEPILFTLKSNSSNADNILIHNKYEHEITETYLKKIFNYL